MTSKIDRACERIGQEIDRPLGWVGHRAYIQDADLRLILDEPKKLRTKFDKLLGALSRYAENGTCANLKCDPFHMHDPECLWGNIEELIEEIKK